MLSSLSKRRWNNFLPNLLRKNDCHFTFLKSLLLIACFTCNILDVDNVVYIHEGGEKMNSLTGHLCTTKAFQCNSNQ